MMDPKRNAATLERLYHEVASMMRQLGAGA